MKPCASSAFSVAVIDCERTPSAIASTVVDDAPSFASRSSTELCAEVSPAVGMSRSATKAAEQVDELRGPC